MIVKRQKWEYLSLRVNYKLSVVEEDNPYYEQHLDRVGAEGWELIKIIAETEESGPMYYAFFRRPGKRLPLSPIDSNE